MKMQTLLAAAAVVALVAGYSFRSVDAKDPDKNVKCPVSGNPVNPEAFVEFDGGKVYFCCKNCPGAFKADKEKFEAKAHHQMVQTEELVEVACPFTGNKLNPATEIEVEGVKVSFCCKKCKATAEAKSGDEQITAIFKDIEKGFKPASEVKKD